MTEIGIQIQIWRNHIWRWRHKNAYLARSGSWWSTLPVLWKSEIKSAGSPWSMTEKRRISLSKLFWSRLQGLKYWAQSLEPQTSYYNYNVDYLWTYVQVISPNQVFAGHTAVVHKSIGCIQHINAQTQPPNSFFVCTVACQVSNLNSHRQLSQISWCKYASICDACMS